MIVIRRNALHRIDCVGVISSETKANGEDFRAFRLCLIGFPNRAYAVV